MTGPDGRKAELEARNAAMREQVSSMLEGLQRQTAQLHEAQASALAATGEATSADGLVIVRVNAAGVVTGTTLAPAALRTSTPEKLATSFTETAQAAAKDARAKADEAVAPLQENVPDLPDVFPGAPSLSQLIPAAPDMPEPNRPSAASTSPVQEDWDDFEPRSRFRKDDG